jgi:adenine-specific DNA-methyltransferase
MPELRIARHFDKNADVVLYNGSCLDLLPHIPERSIKLVVTSPPYNIGKSYEKKTSLDRYLSFQKEVIDECIRVLAPDGSICWQVGNYVENGEIVPLDIILHPLFAKHGLQLRNRIVWHFGHGLHASKRFSGRYEVIMWYTKGDTYYFNIDPVRVPQKYPSKKYYKGPKRGALSGNPLGKNPSDVWDIPNVKSNHIEKTSHPAQFPVELIERLVLSMTREGEWTLDPYSGVGTTQVASVMHSRRSIGAEIVKEYSDLALDRLKKVKAGKLLIRPMNRPVFDPKDPHNIPPKAARISDGSDEWLFPLKKID